MSKEPGGTLSVILCDWDAGFAGSTVLGRWVNALLIC